MGIKGLWKDIERGVKDIRGKDVPESPLRGHEDIKAILQGIANLVEQGAIELHKEAVEAAWDVVKGVSVGGMTITREMYDIFVRAVTDKVIELGGDK